MVGSPPPSNSRLVSLSELVRDWGVSRKIIRRHLRRDGVPAYLLSGARNGTLCYERTEVQAWHRRQRERL